MRHLAIQLAVFAAAIGSSVPASAKYVHTTFSGTIAAVNPGTPTDLGVGTPIVFQVVYDTAKLIDHTIGVNNATGLGFTSVFAASLADDPLASLNISVGSVAFTKFDEINYGTPEGDYGAGCDLQLGNFPSATYLNGAFAGVGNLFVNAAGYSLDADPIADAFGGFDLGSGNGGYSFFIGRSIGGDPFAQVLAVGDYDAKSATISAVPEAGTWALMILGFGVVGGAMRRSFRKSEGQFQSKGGVNAHA